MGATLDVENSYSELGLTADSTDAEIKAAWRRLAARWHPDRNDSPAALRKIQRINRALEQIRKSRRTALAGGADDEAKADPGRSQTGSASEAHDEDHARPERTLDCTVRLTLEEALAGCVRDLQGEVVDDCAQCGATGLHSHASECKACGGAGQVRQPLWFAWMSSLVECSACQGQGVTRPACGACEGSGRAPPRQYRYRVPIPPGMRDGELLHFPASAQTRPGKHKDALAIRIELQPHEFFELEEDGTVKYEAPVDGFAWIASRWVEVPTPAGLQQMKLKRGHLAYRIKGQGFPAHRSGPRADCIVTVVPLFPQEFSSKQEAQIDRLIATNSAAAGTDAGKRVAAWNQRLERWRARLVG
jgi:molecular chaperone DnaJ